MPTLQATRRRKRSSAQANVQALAPPWWLPRTKTGQLKAKLTYDEKLIALDPDATPQKTAKRLGTFIDLFAYRTSDAITTRVNAGPRAWTRLKGGLWGDQVLRHLLANRVPSLPVIWIGARSFKTTRWFCIDVDADRDRKQELTDQFADSPLDQVERDSAIRQGLAREQLKKRKQKPIPSFAERCSKVEDFFRAMGVEADDPRQMMIQTTPSGGRHYYLFTDQPYHLDVLKGMAKTVGVQEIKGQIEFYPSEAHALRLPFVLV